VSEMHTARAANEILIRNFSANKRNESAHLFE
jgi:hypothetical protein